MLVEGDSLAGVPLLELSVLSTVVMEPVNSVDMLEVMTVSVLSELTAFNTEESDGD